MKILSAEQIREADAYTIAQVPMKSIDLMERAAAACFNWIKTRYNQKKRFVVFCGTGNNGGDGLAIARMLYQNGYEVVPYVVRYSDASSPDSYLNEARLMHLDLGLVRNVYSIDDITELEKDSIIIDALFGTGLNKPLSGLAAEVVALMNESHCERIALDMPSGMFADQSSVSGHNKVVKADFTLTFQSLKLAFLFQENFAYTGHVTVLDIGLSKEFMDQCKAPFLMVQPDDVKVIAKPRNPFTHKGTCGHALIVSGSTGKSGAAILAARACLRSGVGLLTLHVPKSVFKFLPVAVPEAMFSSDSDWNCFSDNITTDPYQAIGVGCGIGTSDETAKALKLLIQGYRYPTVFDADAINILAANKSWMEFIPPQSIFTPHPKEFERLVGKSDNQFERNRMQLEFAKKYSVFLLVKGKYTAIACPDGTCYFNPTGNPGMATGGAGDILTGIITGLLAQGFTSKEACLGGVYLHGLAGDIAASKESEQSMIATDIIDCLGDGFRELGRQ